MKRKIGLVIAIIAVGAFASGANATIITYEMDVMPDADATPMTIGAAGGGDGGTGLIGDGTARFTDLTDSGNKGYYLTGLGTSHTVDLRVKSNVATLTGSNPRSMSVFNGANGRGVRLETGGINFINGGNASSGSAAVDLSAYHQLRIVVSPAGAEVYDLGTVENATVPVGGWTPLITGITLGGSGYSPEVDADNGTGGTCINSLGGGSTTNNDIEVAWFRINTDTALGAMDPIIIPEPAALALLGLSGLPMLWRRRR